jgi:hypothetical protein
MDLGPSAPAELVDRPAYPFCGTEDDIPNGTVRRCFWDAVTLHQAPAEFITTVTDASGVLRHVVHRYAGAGGILVYRDRSADPAVGQWTKESCALETTVDDVASFVVAHCVRLPLL